MALPQTPEVKQVKGKIGIGLSTKLRTQEIAANGDVLPAVNYGPIP